MRRLAQEMRVSLLVFLLATMLIFQSPLCAAQRGSDGTGKGEENSLYVPPGPAKDVEVGTYYLHKGDVRAALSRFEEAVAADPTYAAAYLGLGKCYEKIGLKRKALDAYQKYLDNLPSKKDAEEAKDVHRAIARLEKALASPRRGKAPSR